MNKLILPLVALGAALVAFSLGKQAKATESEEEPEGGGEPPPGAPDAPQRPPVNTSEVDPTVPPPQPIFDVVEGVIRDPITGEESFPEPGEIIPQLGPLPVWKFAPDGSLTIKRLNAPAGELTGQEPFAMPNLHATYDHNAALFHPDFMHRAVQDVLRPAIATYNEPNLRDHVTGMMFDLNNWGHMLRDVPTEVLGEASNAINSLDPRQINSVYLEYVDEFPDMAEALADIGLMFQGMQQRGTFFDQIHPDGFVRMPPPTDINAP